MEARDVRKTAEDCGEDETVRRAREGDAEAFSELVRRYRARAYGLARKLTNDDHMAEDVVQDALIRAFMHLGSLMDTSRFLPWLQKIVRNQAYMKLRRGGPYAKEKPFASYRLIRGEQEPQVECDSVDSIIRHLASRAESRSQQLSDPAHLVVKKEMLVGIGELLRCLSPRERGIFEAFFFRELSPQEIADLFGTTTGNVYNFIYRTRHKVQMERLRVYLNAHVQRRRELKLPSKKILAKPTGY